MEIPQQVQDKLKCDGCDELLSCGPVYLMHETGETICGRCSQQSEDSTENKDKTRIEPYEAVASLLAFPCAHAARGCPEKHSFTMGQPPHELNCKFRPFICPIASRESCDWIGSWATLKEHCDDKHASNVLENTSEIPQPDLTSSNLRTYLISAFHLLFLLHVKVCVTSGKLFHSLRMFGNPEFLDKFSYSLKIEGNGIKIKKPSSVLPSGLLTLQETTANSISINALLGILDGKYNELKFTITIQTSLKFCLNCSKTFENASDLKFCEECVGKLVKCKFNVKSCSFVDVNKTKCEKHEKYFCEYETKCLYNCGVNFVAGSLFEHLASANTCRKTISSDINSIVRVTRNTDSNYNYILLSTNKIGTVICKYFLSDSIFKLYLYTSLPSYELKKFECSIELTDPQTKYIQLLTSQIQYNFDHDCYIEVKIDNFPSWENIGIDMKININENIDS